jgi:hypothetical protein
MNCPQVAERNAAVKKKYVSFGEESLTDSSDLPWVILNLIQHADFDRFFDTRCFMFDRFCWNKDEAWDKDL